MTNKLREAALEALKELQQLRPQNQSPFWFRITEDLRAALAQPAASGEPAVIYSPVATKPQVAGRHPNDNETADPERAYWLSLRGDDAGQGLDPYWKWGHKAGWNDHKKHATAQPASAPPGGRYKPLHPGDPYPFCGPSFEAPRNLHPGPRLAGYRGHSLYEHATSEERKAWEEGRAVREEVRRVVTSVDAPPVAFRRFTVLRPTGGKPYALGGMGWQYFDYDPDEYECNVKKALVWTGDEAVQCETTVQRIYAPAPHAQPAPALAPLTDEQALEIAVTATPPGSMASRHQIVEAIRLAERHHGIFPSKENPL